MIKNKLNFHIIYPDILLLFVAIIWGASYAVAKETLMVTSVSALIFFRFSIASLAILPACIGELRRISSADALRGMALGGLLACIFFAETVGVLHTSATNAAFLISLCILLTPIVEALAYRRPLKTFVIACAALCLAGTGLMVSKEGAFSFNLGDLAILGAAVLRAVMVVSTKRLFSRREVSSGALTFLQMASVATLSAVFLFSASGLSGFVPPSDQRFWTGLVFLAFFCTLAAFFIQNWAIRRTSPTRVGFLLGTEPLFGALFAVLLLGEFLTPLNLLGAALILIGTTLGARASQREQGPDVATSRASP